MLCKFMPQKGQLCFFVKSLKKFGQLLMKILINWKNTILIKWILVKRPPVKIVMTKTKHNVSTVKPVLTTTSEGWPSVYKNQPESLQKKLLMNNFQKRPPFEQRSLFFSPKDTGVTVIVAKDIVFFYKLSLFSLLLVS